MAAASSMTLDDVHHLLLLLPPSSFSSYVAAAALHVEPVFIFSGHFLCRWPPQHNKHQGGFLAVGPVITKVFAVVALCKASLSSV
jgi:hypothetical protein